VIVSLGAALSPFHRVSVVLAVPGISGPPHVGRLAGQ